MSSEMVIFTRTYDLLFWLLPKSERFPKIYRHTVTQRLMDATLDFQEQLLTAQLYQSKIRLRHLRAADQGDCILFFLQRINTNFHEI